MKISILVFGSNNFITTLPDQIRDASACSIEVINNIDQAVSYIQITPPDIILVQASNNGSLELCCWLKEQTKLSWIYCILLEDRPQLLASKSQYGLEWEFEINAIALRQGADAYIWLVPKDDTDSSLVDLTVNQRLLSAQLTVGLRKAQKYRDLLRKNDFLSTIALSDALTEFSNRRALDWELPRQIQTARNYRTSLSLIILDVDYFKKVNDTYGHLVGDRLLQLLSQRLRHNLRERDIPFRYGGEEFVILLGNTSCEEALVVAHRLNHIVSEHTFVIDNQLSINITVSLGISCLQAEDDASGISLLERADRYLLQAKAAGRNRVMGCESESENIISQPISHLRVVSS
ncbi:MAG: GGDEF domain-containing protein [Chlorogloeopsis fritschii C42_A2020_084]|uniref:GGDEF domain-containing protein n=1 Tax=Chlorogloeopsis fritschii TaxID=1124 RepID=UPI0019F3569F|nr:GGDEF domain-containing protein [Chlorogloeopsis fritschii]MBF2008194.1 GGDEF domain-containing protein [Chlorogloeopsis fritschii C42_A2020_084]